MRLDGDKYQNICDHNRFVAIKMLGIEDVPIVVVRKMNDKSMKKVLVRFDYEEFRRAKEYRRLNDVK